MGTERRAPATHSFTHAPLARGVFRPKSSVPLSRTTGAVAVRVVAAGACAVCRLATSTVAGGVTGAGAATDGVPVETKLTDADACTG